MKRQQLFFRITLLTSLFLLILGMLYGNYGVWYGRGELKNFAFEQKVTKEELQHIFAKEHWFSFFYFEQSYNFSKDEAIIKFWEASQKTPLLNIKDEASLKEVQEVYPNAKDTLRLTLFNESYNRKTDMFFNVLLLCIGLMFLPLKELRMLSTYFLFNCTYWLAANTVGALLPILLLNLVLFISCVIKEINSLQKIKFFKKFDKLCTYSLWKWNFLKELDLPDFPAFRLFIEGTALLLIATLILYFKNIGILFNIPALIIIFMMVSEVNNRIYSTTN